MLNKGHNVVTALEETKGKILLFRKILIKLKLFKIAFLYKARHMYMYFYTIFGTLS